MAQVTPPKPLLLALFKPSRHLTDTVHLLSRRLRVAYVNSQRQVMLNIVEKGKKGEKYW